MSGALLAARIVLGVTFVAAAIGKAFDLEGSRRALQEFGFSERLARQSGLLPLVELAVGAALLPAASARYAGLAAGVLLLAFAAAIANVRARGRQPDCHCFGRLHSVRAGWAAVARNIVFGGVALFIVIAGPGPSLSGWYSSLDGVAQASVVWGLVLAVLAGLLTWLYYHLLRQHGRVLVRVSALEASLVGTGSKSPDRQPVAVIAAGIPAPGFSLPAVDGKETSLSALLARGTPVLLAFVHPACGPCFDLMPHLAAWQQDLGETLTVAAISEGDQSANEPLLAQHGLRLVLLQAGREVADAYHAYGTPSAVLIGVDGRIAHPLVTGTDRIVALVSEHASREVDSSSPGAAANGRRAALASASATAAVALIAAAPADGTDSERQAISQLIDDAQARAGEDAALIQGATKRYTQLLFTSHGRSRRRARDSLLRAIGQTRGDIASLSQAVRSQGATTAEAIAARSLALQTLELTDQSFQKLDAAARSDRHAAIDKLIRESRSLFDQSVELGAKAKAALTQP
jgi:peroxiredoxin/uncharacterized membrane protein YphA (DoxX/SURF4 family)